MNFARSPRTWLALAAVVILIILAWLIFARQSSTGPVTGQPIFGATITPLADIAQNIAGEAATIVQLVPSGASPHSYNVTPQDLSALQGARALFAIGHGLDDWSGRPAAEAVDVPFVVVDPGIELRPFAEDDSIDPHYWLTVPNAKIIAANIAHSMIERDPSNTAAYQANLAAYERALDGLETELQLAAKQASQPRFMAMHDAWSYFADHYGFELVATYEPVEGQEPTVADLQNLQSLARQHGITVFYAEPQKQSSAATQFLERELGLTIRVLDPEGGPGRQTYAEMMRYNMEQLTD